MRRWPAYTAKKIRERAVTIARTEIMGALNRRAQESFLQARAAGFLGPNAQKEWIATEGACVVCSPMDGVKVRLAEAFGIPGPPAHPRCLCTIVVAP